MTTHLDALLARLPGHGPDPQREGAYLAPCPVDRRHKVHVADGRAWVSFRCIQGHQVESALGVLGLSKEALFYWLPVGCEDPVEYSLQRRTELLPVTTPELLCQDALRCFAEQEEWAISTVGLVEYLVGLQDRVYPHLWGSWFWRGQMTRIGFDLRRRFLQHVNTGTSRVILYNGRRQAGYDRMQFERALNLVKGR